MPPWRTLLVDDHALFREGLARLFAYQEDFEVVGEAADATGALEQAGALAPDLVLMDIDLPGDDGVTATRQLRDVLPAARVVMLTVHDDTRTLFSAIKAGAQGYLLKSIRSAELLQHLRGVMQGEAAISGRLAARVLEEFRSREEAPPAGRDAPPDLTAREREVLALVAARLSNKEIAEQLVLSEHTVKNHLKHILGKLHLRSRRQAVAYGITRGWVRPREEHP